MRWSWSREYGKQNKCFGPHSESYALYIAIKQRGDIVMVGALLMKMKKPTLMGQMKKIIMVSTVDTVTI